MDYLLWENGAPDFDPSIDQPEPTLTSYFANVENGEKRGCVIVVPGGGYVCRAEHEGEPVARMLGEVGIHAFVLNYRVHPYKYPVMQNDILRAIRWVRYHAVKFGIDENKIGILGFSAGGHLCTLGIEQFDYGKEDGDEIDRVSSRPDAGVLCYPVVSFVKYVNDGSRDALIGREYDRELARKLSGEVSVRDDMPPVFMWHTSYDNYVPVENSLYMALALQEKRIPFALHVFPDGDHGLGLSESIESTAQWAPLLQRWLLDLKF